MNRYDFHILARTRLKEARALLYSNMHHGAYYLAGYAIECGLKACIAKKTRRYDFPDKQLAFDSYIHNIEKLVKVAGLQIQLVIKWSEDTRYNTIISPAEAGALYSAITARTNGVMTWIRSQW
jgi:HEPN domain-containing protein